MEDFMDKEKLEEYRGRLEDLLETMEISFKDSEKIAEYEKRLEELEKPVDMTDVGSALVIDRRHQAMEEKEYPDDEEGKLLSELAKRRSDERIEIQKISEIIEQIKTIRQNKKEAERADISSALEHVKMQEELYSQIAQDQQELQEQIAQKQEEIQKLREKTEKLKQDEKELVSQISDNITIMGMKKPDSMVYQSASKENAKLIASKRGKLATIKRNENKIAKTEKEITSLQDNYQELDDFIAKLTEKQKDLKKEDHQEEIIQEETKQEVEEQKHEEKPLPQDEIRNQPQEELEPLSEPAVRFVPQRQFAEQTQTENTIKGINFTIENGNIPCYSVVIVDKHGQEQIRSFTGFQYVDTVAYQMKQDQMNELEKQLEEKGLNETRKFYDRGLTEVLSQIDAEFGTKGVKKYENMIRTKHQQTGIDEKTKLSIDYDFSGLYGKIHTQENKAKLKSLQKVAKAGQNATNKIASYQKAPNILKRLWKRMNIKLLTEPAENLPNNQRNLETEIEYKQNSEIINLIEKNYQILRDEEGFDINTFIESYDLDSAEAEKYRKMQQEYQKKEPQQDWKESLKQKVDPIGEQIKQKVDPIQQQVATRVNAMMYGLPNKKDPRYDITKKKLQQYKEEQKADKDDQRQ